MRYFEDFKVGESLDLGRRSVSAAEIIAFARQFDPQPFHVDEEAAGRSIYGGLIASGWHTAGLFMRMLNDGLLLQASSLGSPGLEELRWPAPVRPGDTLSGSITVVEVRPSKSRPEMGIVRWRGEGRNQRGELVMTLSGTNFFGRRPASA
jgi:acyl dehydratase